MSMQVYPPIIIINIITNKFIPHRGFELISNSNISDDNIIFTIEKTGYYRLNAINKKNPRKLRNKVVFILLKNNDSGGELKKLKKIIYTIDNDEVTKSNKLDELFIIVDKDLFSKKNFIDVIKELNLRQYGGLDLEGNKPFYTICSYHNFAFDLPNCKIIYPHEIMTNEEVNELLSHERISAKDLPIILNNDVTIIWNGARVGQIIRILRKSESALESIYYRRVEGAR